MALLISLAPALPAAETAGEPDPSDEARPRYGAAAVEAFGSNVVVHLFDRFVLRADYAQASWSSASRNLRSAWVFDHDIFATNEIAHPYHGYLYFAAGRSNGLGFWSSSALTVLGSATWELFGEKDPPSMNDIVATTMGGMALGEIFHRVYRSARLGGSPLRLVVSPMDFLTDCVYGERDAEFEEPASMALSLRGGACFPFLDLDETRGIEAGPAWPMAQVAESLSYGDPFGEGGAPFSHFEQRLRLGASPSSYEIAFFSNGSLCSLPIADGPRGKLAVGADLHFDFVFSSIVELSANSVGLSLAGARRFDGGLALSCEAHLNAVAMGTNDDVFLRELKEDADELTRSYDFGFGEGAKICFLAFQPVLGALSLEWVAYDLRPFPSSLEEGSDFDRALVCALELAYERGLGRHLALGASYLRYDKLAFYDRRADVRETLQSVSLYMKIL
jgi:hypothetical protein